MAIITETNLDLIQVEPMTGGVFWRFATVVKDDSLPLPQQEIARTYHRGSATVIDLAFPNMPPEVVPYKNLLDTPEVRARAQAILDAGFNIGGGIPPLPPP